MKGILFDSPSSKTAGPNFSHMHHLKSLAVAANRADLLGANPQEKALIHQWIELTVSHVSSSSSDARCLSEELDAHLSSRCFLVGHRLTLADLLLFAATHAHFSSLSFQEKERVGNASRWFAHVQHCLKDSKLGRSQQIAEVTF